MPSPPPGPTQEACWLPPKGGARVRRGSEPMGPGGERSPSGGPQTAQGPATPSPRSPGEGPAAHRRGRGGARVPCTRDSGGPCRRDAWADAGGRNVADWGGGIAKWGSFRRPVVAVAVTRTHARVTHARRILGKWRVDTGRQRLEAVPAVGGCTCQRCRVFANGWTVPAGGWKDQLGNGRATRRSGGRRVVE